MSKCSTCKYRTNMGKGARDKACYYIAITGHIRPCPPGDECTKYKKGKAMKAPSL